MMTWRVRPPAVAGSFYPGDERRLRDLVERLVAEAATGARASDGAEPGATASAEADGALPVGILVPHAGLVYSGAVAAAAWGRLRHPAGAANPPVVVILGTNHSAAWLHGVGAWTGGAWATPTGEVEVDATLAAEVVALGLPFAADPVAHLDEHSIEVQLPLLVAVAPDARIVPLAVSCGTGRGAAVAGERLGTLLAALREAGEPIVLAISTDMAHYPDAADAAAVTDLLLPHIEALDAAGLASLEGSLRERRMRGLACGMCGIEPAVLGLAALRAMGARRGTALAAATSADAGGSGDRTVGYLSVRFDT
jgi:hypothetical protein